MAGVDWEIPLKRVLSRELDRLGLSGYQLLLFGSRARGNASPVSDIDIGIKGVEAIPFPLLSELRDAVDNLNLPFKVDLVDMTHVSREFYEHAMEGAIVWKG
ncbi:Nucleotidyltransferase domain protein [Acididesulfobacillus acetoxydans]|uniref:GrpB/Dephospho-CoA kinase n=1 Tax=Acididesulfobacillus acetoxydans TaxID=1561005 RepID=A0A8S0VVJ2_9FIRM|nr:nucleotidyltransferase domain-containing protein [Acididesulfobacillus acetoxydans]CAA7599613.1 Nucleotidyltransferase domain protein [Acididesulfobacillus acetoxydans]CEJ06476.1 GrpB/Dephospho-CoA kinase [Acididesulfobacillus acetoxydans]